MENAPLQTKSLLLTEGTHNGDNGALAAFLVVSEAVPDPVHVPAQDPVMEEQVVSHRVWDQLKKMDNVTWEVVQLMVV